MSTSKIWLSAMEVMARSCDVVLLIDSSGRLCEVTTLLTLSSDLVSRDAVGCHISEIITTGEIPQVGGGGREEERPVEMRVEVTDSQGRVRECRSSVVGLPAVG